MKKETLEEAAEKYSEPYRCPATNENEYCRHDIISAFNNGAKWQQERSYSEEIIDILDNVRYWETCPNSYKVIIERFIEQFKKK